MAIDADRRGRVVKFNGHPIDRTMTGITGEPRIMILIPTMTATTIAHEQGVVKLQYGPIVAVVAIGAIPRIMPTG